MHVYPFRLAERGATRPKFPAECEPHTPMPSGYGGWADLAEAWYRTRDQRQCRGCGLWAIWEPRAIEANLPDGTCILGPGIVYVLDQRTGKWKYLGETMEAVWRPENQ